MSMETYARDIRNVRFLSRAEETELALRSKTGDISARNALIESLLPWAFRLASDFSAKRHCDLSDTVQHANFGLMAAIERFDPSTGNRLITYSRWWIVRFMVNMTLDDGLIRIPRMARKGHGTKKTQAAKEKALRVGELPSMLTAKKDDPPFDEADFERLRANLENLPERWRDVVIRRANGETFVSIGREHGVTKSRAQQIYEGAIEYLRKLF